MLSGIIFIYMFSSIGLFCSLLYQLSYVSTKFVGMTNEYFPVLHSDHCFFLQSAANISFQMYQAVGLMFAGLSFMFLLSLIGQLVAEKSFSIGESAYSSLWYMLPLKLRIYVKLIIQSSHRPFNLTAWGLMDCNLGTFVAVGVNVQCNM